MLTEDLTSLVEDLTENPVEEPTGDSLTRLQELGRRVLVIDEQLVVLEERIAARKKVRNEIVSRQMPDLMTQVGVDHVGVGGHTFRLEDFYHASIAKDSPTRDEAFNWLEKNEESGIIKYTVTATFPKDSTEQAQALAEYVTKRYQNATVEIERGVPWSRLTSWLKEMYERKRGDEPHLKLPPLDIMGATVGAVVKIVKPRGKRS